jgi:hypothetical protein
MFFSYFHVHSQRYLSLHLLLSRRRTAGRENVEIDVRWMNIAAVADINHQIKSIRKTCGTQIDPSRVRLRICNRPTVMSDIWHDCEHRTDLCWMIVVIVLKEYWQNRQEIVAHACWLLSCRSLIGYVLRTNDISMTSYSSYMLSCKYYPSSRRR